VLETALVEIFRERVLFDFVGHGFTINYKVGRFNQSRPAPARSSTSTRQGTSSRPFVLKLSSFNDLFGELSDLIVGVFGEHANL
jgi:hypothetical protein